MNEISAAAAIEGKSNNANFDAFDELPLPYIQLDEQGVITRANRASFEIHPEEAGNLVGRHAWELMPVKYQAASRTGYACTMQSGKTPPVERQTHYTRAGEFRSYDVYHTVIRGAEGRPIGMRILSVDVTEAKNKFDEAVQKAFYLERILASIEESIIVTDALGFICYVNHAATELTGWSAAQLIGKPIEKGVPLLEYRSEDMQRLSFNMALERRCRGVASILDCERCEVVVDIATSPILEAETGNTTGVVSILHRIPDICKLL
jgi:PAS domain S-box-containing protein